MRRILLCSFRDGNTIPTDDGAALIYGVTVEELRAAAQPGMTPADLPEAMQRKARKRTKAAKDALGDTTASLILAYWAIQTWQCSIDHDEAAGQLWAVIGEP